jgi:vacuolar-type H+-ATPase subunit I/STV1
VSDHLGIILILAIMGFALIGMGLGAVRGYFKTLYLIKGISGLYPSGYIYAFIPAGTLSLLFTLAFMLPNRELGGHIVAFGSLGIMVISIVLMTWKPTWLKPWWLKWLEDHYGHVIEGMLEEARNTKDFEQQTRTEVDLEAWAASVAQKNGW